MSEDWDSAFREGLIDGYWAGASGVASGILPYCPATKRFCLAARSPLVHQGCCWSTIGGACPIDQGPCESALREFREETSYEGAITTRFLYCFRAGKFRYLTYLGIVESEFGLPGDLAGCWETTRLRWLPLAGIQQTIEIAPERLHPGMRVMLQESGAELLRIVEQGRFYNGTTQPTR